jgi:SpoVK/Ycf46/Vps4 family AAA+-type ATPase
MFAGPSGTGKTLTAEVIAEALGVDLYRIDLAQVVDKYIGETEKKLAELFDAAEASPMVLLFDEADALIGRRTEVSSSHDRHANIQVAYLLQRLERHTGVTILSTNLASNIDSAFLRRIQVSVNFGRPGAAERLRIWRANLPTGMPVGEVDLDGLADLELSGGQIRNVMVRAAFLAAEVGTALDQRLIVVALTREMEKSGRMFRAEDFHLPSG